ncbi:uveal autoantigen with coiled-coil domains and ankyrin repeats isoform X2 [Varanus komodoensis]|uniref:uveal autoantigen with coiled-coil domains and ankyrin repeats isoform X2 n=1 Tax=Varanus komodoensis TaxID=61221 RepID=UPI001CF76FBC|nr:uveal autoantigen with coiled-coil domains and ankyrin repeats isoform X2 [Varanus komodoensis]
MLAIIVRLAVSAGLQFFCHLSAVFYGRMVKANDPEDRRHSLTIQGLHPSHPFLLHIHQGARMSSFWLTADWNKYDDRLMKAAERGDVEKLSSVLAKKGVNPTKLDVEGRSVFHVIASKGNLDCLNVILIHGVDIVATDVAGRNALHLAAKYGHALCLQKLLQYNCPTENVDLQGRTALHDAAMSDCSSSIQLLCDHGASVNAKDTDGRTPLVLATQMCHPLICQLLLDRGADVNARDKQNRTALMLGCEYGCKDAVEVLLRNGADVTLVDGLGHDCSYYARIGDNVGILALVKAALEESNKASYEVMKKGQPAQKVLPKWSQPSVSEEASFKPYQKEHRNVQELERANEDLKGRLREIQQEHRILLDRINGLQLQLNEEQMVADDLESEKDELRRLLAAKEKQQEESGRLLEALKLKLRFYEGDHGESGSGFGNRKEAALLKSDSAYPAGPQHAPASAPAGSQSRSMVRPLELLSQSSASETEALKRELSSMRSCYEAARADVGKLQLELAHKAAECKALASECERTKLESDRQIKQLEDALKDVQKRMFDSEGKVKQMQAHFLALKDHLTSEAVAGNSKMAEELRDVKAKYEGASAEVGKLRNQLKQNELLVEEFRRDEARLVEENKKVQKELGMLRTEHENSERRVSESESQLKETAARLTDKFEKMKSSLSVEIDEKSWKLAEMEKEREKLSTEVQALRTELESQKAQFAQYVRPEEFRHVKSRYEQRAKELERAHAELKHKNQALQKEVERANASSSLLKQQVGTLRSEMRTQYVPLKVSEEMKKASDAAAGELNRQLAEVTEKYHRSKAESEKLLAEKACLRETVGRLQTAHIPLETHEKENEALKATVSDLKRQLAELGQKHKGEQAKAFELASKNETLQNVMKERYVPVEAHKETQAALNSLLEKAGQELTDLKGEMVVVKQELAGVNEENGALKMELGALRSQIESEYLSRQKHNEVVAVLNKTIQELRESSSAMQAKYKEKQDEVAQLHAEVGAQKQELDTIQECIRSKYAPLINLEEKERHFETTVKELKSQLLQKEQQHREKEEELKARSQDNEKLRAEVLALQTDLQQNYVPAKAAREAERVLEGRLEGLSRQLRELQHSCAEAEQEKGHLQEECARLRAEALEAQGCLQGRSLPVEQAEGLEQRLEGTIEGLRGELGRETARCEQERRNAQALRQELEQLRAASVPLAEHERVRGALEREVSAARSTLREEEAEGRVRREEISRLQSELQSAKRALKELEAREVVELSEHKAVTCRLEGQVLSMAEKLAKLGKELEGMQEEARQGKAEELPVKDEKELLQPRSVSIEQEIKDQKERCDKSLSTIVELQKRMQESAKQVEAKDNKITELLNDVERLKQALHGLSQLTYNGSLPAAKRQASQVETLQTQDAERQHQEVISTYRTHLLSAVQGHMDEDVQAALLQIIRMRQGLVC